MLKWMKQVISPFLIMNIFEKIVRDEIFIKCSHLLNKTSMASYQRKSCETQTIYFQECLTSSLNNDIQTDVVYFDFSKAFESVNHDILLNKLKHLYGLNGRLLKFLVDNLRDRQQCVIIWGQKSDYRPVASGVPKDPYLAHFFL